MEEPQKEQGATSEQDEIPDDDSPASPSTNPQPNKVEKVVLQKRVR